VVSDVITQRVLQSGRGLGGLWAKGARFNRGLFLDITLRLLGATPRPTFEMTSRLLDDRRQSRITDI
jgi:hypothetical protein